MYTINSPFRTIGISGAVLSICSILVPFACIGPNSSLGIGAIATLAIGGILLWRPGESPILFFIFVYQWVQTSISLFPANWQGMPVAQFSGYNGDIEKAVTLSLISLIALALGARLGAGPIAPRYGAEARRTASLRPPLDWFLFYVAAFVVASAAQAFAWVVPGLSQPLLALASMKWAFFWMLAFATFLQRVNSIHYFLIAFAIEFVLGFGGYFSDFKTVIYFSLFAAIASGVRFSPQSLIGLAVVCSLLLVLALVWTAVKRDYRAFVRGGQNSQIVKTDYSTSVAKLADLASKLKENDITAAGNALLKRLSYVDFFGLVLDHVPRALPHEDGALWWDAMSRPFSPRLVFPEKGIIDDSVRTRKYTGLDVSGMKEGTSISIGYIAESYIDFGEFWMMAPIFLLGLFYGRIHRELLNNRRSSGVVGMALSTAILYVPAPLETSITKSFGGLVVALLVAWLIVRFVAPNLMPRAQVDLHRRVT